MQVMNVISQTDWESGKCFLGSSVQSQAVTVASQHRPRLKKGFSDPRGEAARRETPKVATDIEYTYSMYVHYIQHPMIG